LRAKKPFETDPGAGTEFYDLGFRRFRLRDECWVTPIQRLET
jgi:hypothetical protein